MKAALTTIALVILLAVAIEHQVSKPVPSTLVSEAMAKTYGTNWAVELTAARTNKTKLDSMLATYYNLQHKYASTSNTPSNWVGWKYVSTNNGLIAGTTN